jgi:hypothetical protein
MIRTENILSFPVKSFLVNDLERKSDEEKKKSCPPPVKRSYEPELLRKEDGDQEQKEKDYK